MTSRTQITLDREMQRRVRKRASELGISLAEYVRRLVARDLGQPERRADPSVIFGLGDSGGTDIARDKDALIGAAVAEQGRRRKASR
jgi:hypothetical protein